MVSLPRTEAGGPTAKPYAVPSSLASSTSATPRAAPTTSAMPYAVLSTPPAPQHRRVRLRPHHPRLQRLNSCRPQAAWEPSTSHLHQQSPPREGRIGGTSDQPLSDDHTGEVGLLTSGQQTHPVGHLGVNLVAGALLHPCHPH
jgi:hypothetical protein